MAIPDILLPIINVKTNSFDALLTGLGLRFMQLAKTSEDFQALLEGKDFVIQMASDEGVARHYKVQDGEFTQHYGFATEADLTMTFVDNETGVEVLTKGEPTAFMTAVQDKELKVEGDYALMMWFAKAGKYVVPRIPPQAKEAYTRAKPYVEQAKPYAEMAVPAIKNAFNKLRGMRK